jgi:hypothetical protein
MADSGALVDDQPAAIVDVIGNAGVMRLFWSSDRGQGRSIYTLVITNGVPGPAVRLTNHPSGNDQYPAVVKDFDGTLWLFWQSSRRGPTDIWAMTFARNATDWSGPQRITSGQPADTTPSAVIGADGHLQLFWTAARGSGSRIFQSVFDGTTWSVGVDFLASLPGADPAPPTTSKIRDEAPAALAFQGLCVYWQSDLDGTPHIYTTQQGGVHGETWSPPFRVTAGNAPEREPRAYRWHGALRLFFRTQRPAQQPASSLTVDFSNLGNMKRGQPDDQWHYTYSTTEPAAASSLAEDPVYARDAVGLYLTPDAAAGGADHRAVVSRAQAFIEPFRPANVRLLWFLPPGDPAA